MIKSIVNITTPEDYLKLLEIIPDDYLSASLINDFQRTLDESVKTVVVEYPYIDKDYRSTYYGFYSKRHRTYSKFCIRLHLFKGHIDNEEGLSDYFSDYMGSMVLRPTEVTPLGRTLLSPLAIKSFQGYICEATFENNLMGVPLRISSFPHLMQDTDVTVCAHAVCWMIARYYSEKYSVYPERLTYDIATAVQGFSTGRLIPSRGITLGQVSEILASIGFSPEIYGRDAYQDESLFYDILYAYIESGIPLVAGLSQKEHAVAILGHGPIHSASSIINGFEGPLINARHCLKSFIVNDDNRLPYASLENYREVDGFVVPLYEKMYLGADHVLEIFPKLASGNLLTIPLDSPHIARVYMTSSRSYKRHLKSCQDIHPELIKAQIELPMPKFIWMVEIARPENFDQGKTDFRWIMDSTANQYEKYPFMLIHDRGKMLIHDRVFKGELFQVVFSHSLEPFQLFKNNLRSYL